jgi:hypothetical protein
MARFTRTYPAIHLTGINTAITTDAASILSSLGVFRACGDLRSHGLVEGTLYLVNHITARDLHTYLKENGIWLRGSRILVEGEVMEEIIADEIDAGMPAPVLVWEEVLGEMREGLRS